MDILENQLNDLKKTTEYKQVQLAANDNLNGWIAADLEDVHLLKECKWKLDEAVFFNTKKDRAYLLLLIQDNLETAELDYAYVMYAALDRSVWKIYFAGLPGYVFPRARFAGNKTVPFQVLSKLSRGELLKGYYDENGDISDSFVNKPYTSALLANHVKFLHKKYQ